MEELVKQVSKISEVVNMVLENQIYMRNDISKLQEGQEQMQNDITKMQGDITKMQGDITKMQVDITKMQGDISEMQGDISEMQGHIDRLETEMKVGFSDVSSEFRRIYYIFDKMPNHQEILKISKEYLATEN